MKHRAYLVVSIDSLLRVTGVAVWSASPLTSTRGFRNGKFSNTVATIYKSADRDSYADAADECWDFYANYCDPSLVARFPAPASGVA